MEGSGVMRITVAVVVIMFELTGALTYILPTMVSNSNDPSQLPYPLIAMLRRSYSS